MKAKTQKHTAEPWRLTRTGLWSSAGMVVCSGHESATTVERATGERIVACVNACAGINPESVSLAFKEIPSAIQYLEKAVKFFKYQRSGRSDREFWPNREECEGIIDGLRAAIAKSEEGS